MSVALECKNITKKYKKKKQIIEVLDGVSYKFCDNMFYVIKGQSGAGKSTLIQILGLLTNFDSGDIYIGDKNIKDLNDKEKSFIRNKKIGFVFQSFYLNPLLKSYENVLLPLNINCNLSKEKKKKLSYDFLNYLGLKGRETHFPNQLSGGEQQRVAIARALINNPSIILADEPTGSLDANNSKMIYNTLKKLAQKGKCVIVVSHSDEIDKYADEIVYISDKRLICKKMES